MSTLNGTNERCDDDDWQDVYSSLRMLAWVLVVVTLAGGTLIVFGGLWIARLAQGWVR